METFGTAINCIDGRAQQPVTDWVRLHCNVKFVDMVTCPGANAVLASFRTDRARHIVEEVGVSVRKHMSSVIAVAGHFDCAGNPVSYEEHKEQILRCADRIRNWDFGVRVVGIYVNEWFSIDVVCDSQEDFPQIKSWL